MRVRLLFILSFALVSACAEVPEDAEPRRASGIASELASAATTKRVALSTGVELAYLEQGRSHGEPVIFLHGFTASHHHFDLNLPTFPRRFHVYALDLRGYGDSSKPACCYTHAEFAADVIAFMDALCLPSASLVGHSMGSLIAHKVAVEHPDRVDKLVLLASAPSAAGARSSGLRGFVYSLPDPVPFEIARAFQQGVFFQPVPESFILTATAESLKSPLSIWKQTVDAMQAEDHAAALSQISAPTLIVWGDQDTVFNAADQAALDTQIPNSTLIVYEQTGHGLHVEEPQRTNHDLAHFLR